MGSFSDFENTDTFELIREEDAIEMIDLVLDDPCCEVSEFHDVLFPIRIEEVHLDTQPTKH